MAVYKQKVIFYDEEDNIETKRLVIPKVINTDISFELMFGVEPPNYKWGVRQPGKEKIEYIKHLRINYYEQ
jgi:hypothetical protein